MSSADLESVTRLWVELCNLQPPWALGGLGVAYGGSGESAEWRELYLGSLQSVPEDCEPGRAMQIGDSGGLRTFQASYSSTYLDWEWIPVDLGPTLAMGDFPTTRE